MLDFLPKEPVVKDYKGMSPQSQIVDDVHFSQLNQPSQKVKSSQEIASSQASLRLRPRVWSSFRTRLRIKPRRWLHFRSGMLSHSASIASQGFTRTH